MARGVLSREDISDALTRAERTARADGRGGDISPANLEAMAFPARVLRLLNNSSTGTETPTFSEIARLVGELKDQNWQATPSR